MQQKKNVDSDSRVSYYMRNGSDINLQLTIWIKKKEGKLANDEGGRVVWQKLPTFQRCFIRTISPKLLNASIIRAYRPDDLSIKHLWNVSKFFFLQNIRSNIPEHSHIHTCRRENLKSHRRIVRKLGMGFDSVGRGGGGCFLVFSLSDSITTSHALALRDKKPQ
jgi:hypothetical protein